MKFGFDKKYLPSFSLDASLASGTGSVFIGALLEAFLLSLFFP